MKKILIIEDNLDLAENIYTLLKEYGYTVFLAKNGEDGMNAIIAHQPDLILCDILLPDITGYRLLKELKKLRSIIAPIFIFITAKVQREDLRKGMTLGADDYITKPFTYEELIGSINTQFQKRSQIFQSVNSSVTNLLKNGKEIDKGKSRHEKAGFDYGDHIFIDSKKNPGFYPIESIIVIKSMKDYTHLYFSDQKKFILRRPMIYWESNLPSGIFIRIHKQTMINIKYVDKVELISSNRLVFILRVYPNKLEASQRYSQKIRKLFN